MTPGQAKAGDSAVERINALCHTKGEWAGQPFDLRPWQEDLMRRLFGTLRPDGTRQYRTAFLEIPRKNGKTELGAAIALLMLCGDGEQGGEVYSAAADRDQASLVFNVAAQMVRQNPTLSKTCKIIDSQKRIVHQPSWSVYRAISSEAGTKHGFNASAVIYDELHAAPNRELFDVLQTSMGARRQPLMLAITTAGYDRQSVCYEVHDYALKVRDNIIEDPTFLPLIYAAPDDADWQDEDVWHAANPALGDFRKIDEMRAFAARAREVPAQENVFRRLYLCQWTEQAERWLSVDAWQEGADDIDLDDLVGRECYAGLDLSSTSDLTAFVLLFPPAETGDKWTVVPRFWVPADSITKRSLRDNVPYDVWAKQGFIAETDGNVVDYDAIRVAVGELGERFNILEIAADRWNSAHLLTQLAGDGFEVVTFGQGFASMAGPTKELEKLVVGRQLAHGGHPVLRWMASNVTVRQDPAGNLKPDKSKSGDKIDGIVALIMALGRATQEPPKERSVYEDPDFFM